MSKVVYLGYNVKEAFVNAQGREVPKRYELRFLDAEKLEYITFQVVDIPDSLKEAPITMDSLLLGTLVTREERVFGSSNTYKRKFDAFTDVKIARIAPVAL